MLSQNSIRGEFTVQLVFASIALIAIFSLILYGYIRNEINGDIQIELINKAELITTSHKNYKLNSIISDNEVVIHIVKSKKKYKNQIEFKEFKDSDKFYIQLLYPYKLKDYIYINITKDLTTTHKLLNKIFNSILFLNFITLILIILYAFIFSKIMLKPVILITNKLIKRDENYLKEIKIKNLPIEFLPLGKSINRLINKITLYIKYKKEFFIGTAHELKTPLAVMKLKNELTLKKDRTIQEYKDVIKLNIASINELNIMIGSILEMGRAEGAQFEEAVEIDIIKFLKEKVKDFELLANKDNKKIILELIPKQFTTTIQLTLLNHILYNFIQNAINFSSKGGKIFIKAKLIEKNILRVDIIDEGCGIDENINIFAPFTRKGENAGLGLGLFLAQSSAQALGAKIGVKNRDESRGSIAFLKIYSSINSNK